MENLKEKYVKSPLNYVGGKYKLLPQIIPLMPNNIRHFVDLFGGGFNVGINVDCEITIYNDIESHVVELMEYLSNKDIDFLQQIEDLIELDRFPTHSEIENFYGDKALTNKISKSGGTKYWADKLRYKVKQCESEFGNYYERYALDDILLHTGLNGYVNKVGYPYDLTISKHIKIDIKVSNIVINNVGYRYHSFNIEKKEPTCDIFILYCLRDNGNIYKTKYDEFYKELTKD